MDIYKINTRKWNEYIQELVEELRKADFRFSRIIRADKTIINIIGGRLPLCYDFETGTCSVWSKCSRHSGYHVSIDDLIVVQKLIRNWKERNFQE
ncbi:TPA: hypothetical protein ACXNW8_001366 [Clostridium botulinum]|uniref:hypothetical protein n=1 Tax=Clostridium botulinum TaxID=1491 RepID=UPI001C9B4CC1|nr:hypothetical protein [Clostridium botulinum]MBY6909568.1 hypothetical protein [Clostridium botulinum]